VAQQTRTDWSFSEQFEPDLFWQRHGKKIIYAIVALLAIGAVAYVWQRQQAEEADRMAQRLDTATDPQALQSIIHDLSRQTGCEGGNTPTSGDIFPDWPLC